MSDESNCTCINCGGHVVDDHDEREHIRQMIEAMTADMAANPDLAAKLWITLKLAAEKVTR